MLDSYSRKVLNYLKKNGRGTYKELIRLGNNREFMADLILNLNVDGYIILVTEECNGVKYSAYEIKYKGIAALEEYNRYIMNYYPSLIISVIALLISVIGLVLK